MEGLRLAAGHKWRPTCPCTAGLGALLRGARPKRPAGGPTTLPEGLDFRRTPSGVLERAGTASITGPYSSPSRLRVVQDARIEDRYTLGKELIGEGCCRCGGVRVITDKASKQRCVLKSLDLSNQDVEHWQDLFNEVEVYLRLDHPNICRLLEVYADEYHCHLVMELCTGRELFDRFEARGRYSEQDTATAVAQMLDALRYMHHHNVCHRDLKLENWMYADESEHARLKLIDFGFSKVFTPDIPMTVILGTIFYIAPEVFKGAYDLKCDVWSTGVITYMLLSGVLPFGRSDDTDEEVIEHIMKGPAQDMEGPPWQEVSNDAKDFVTKLLARDPAQRPTAREAASHPWLVRNMDGQHHGAKEISVQVLESMQNFGSMNVIKRAACGLIAYTMNVKETDWLEAQFKSLDTDGTGTITLQELVDALKAHLGVSEEEATELFNRLDVTGNKEINYSGFLAAANQRRFLAQESTIQAAFQRFDVDGTGYISLENLREVFGDEYAGTKVEDIIAQVDFKRNGVIEYDEFVRALMDLGSPGCASKPGNTELVKKISRAFEFTSVGAAHMNTYIRRSIRRGRSVRRSPAASEVDSTGEDKATDSASTASSLSPRKPRSASNADLPPAAAAQEGGQCPGQELEGYAPDLRRRWSSGSQSALADEVAEAEAYAGGGAWSRTQSF